MKKIRCRYCGRPSEDGSGVCDRCERTQEKHPRLTFRAKRQGVKQMEKNMETLSDGLPRAARTRRKAMNANSTTDQARGAAAQRDATVHKLEAALLAQHAQARATAK